MSRIKPEDHEKDLKQHPFVWSDGVSDVEGIVTLKAQA